MKKFVENIAKLINVKTIITLLVMAVFVTLSLNGKINSDEIMYVTITVISFYFGTQHEKKNSSNNNDK